SARGGRTCHAGPSCGPAFWARGRPGSTSPPRGGPARRTPRRSPALHRLLRDRVLRSGRDAHHDLARGPGPGRRSDTWRLTVVDGAGRYQLRLGELAAFGARMRATLDCTSGWYAQQDWTG